MNRLALVVVVALSRPVFADDPLLSGLRASLRKTKEQPAVAGLGRAANPELTVAKHRLRDWVESKLPSLPRSGDAGDFARDLNRELRAGGFFCGEDTGDQTPCPEWVLSGLLNPVRARRDRGFLIVQTGVGIECGFDESAYLYVWSDEGWRRVWQTEQNVYDEKVYRPQTIQQVLVSPVDLTNHYAVLTLGSQSWCMSNLHDVYYRAFRLGPLPDAPPVVEGTVWAHIDGAAPISGSVTKNDVLIEATAANGPNGMPYEVVRHYRFEPQVRRVDPYALSPRDLVWEWLHSERRLAAAMSERRNWAATSEWHQKLANRSVEIVFPTMHCPATPDLWQVAVAFDDWSIPPRPNHYFQVRWRPPYEFRMVEISERPWPECTREDRRADEPRTLFPK